MDIITHTRVTLGLQGTTWDQELSQGILQGSSYSAELFARCIDYYSSGPASRWQEEESTWLQTDAGYKLFLTPIADDLVLLGTSREQTQRLLYMTVKTPCRPSACTSMPRSANFFVRLGCLTDLSSCTTDNLSIVRRP